MTPRSDSLPAGGARFQSTAWSLIREAQDARAPDHDRAVERLISIHWRPVYWTLRHQWAASPEEAKDLTQEYFSSFLEKDLLADVSREHGRFRAYVKATLRHFMLHQRRAGRAARRGGGQRVCALDDLGEVEAENTAADDAPDRRFDRELMRSILKNSLEALETACGLEGKPEHFALFRHYYREQAAGRAVDYADLQRRFTLSRHEVKNRLVEMRLRFRRTVLAFLRDGVSSESELVAEIRDVFRR